MLCRSGTDVARPLLYERPLTGVYNMVRHIVARVFRCRPVGGQLVENNEVSAFRWESPPEIHDLMTEAYATRILDGLRAEREPTVRAHNGANLLSG
jgi:8-oxo-dGTP diphosphatase